MSHYDTLGIPKDADEAIIRKAFKSAARKAHPDRKGGSHERMQELNIAYAILSDAERREHYDRTGTDKPLTTMEQKSRAVLCQLFLGLIMAGRDERDPMEQMHEALVNGDEQHAANARELEQERAKFQRWVGKVHSTGDNLFMGVVNQRLAAIAEKLAAVAAEREIIAVARKMLGEYRFDFKPPKPKSPHVVISYDWTSGAAT